MRGLVDANRFPALTFLPPALCLRTRGLFPALQLRTRGRLALGLDPVSRHPSWARRAAWCRRTLLPLPFFPLGLFPALGLGSALLGETVNGSGVYSPTAELAWPLGAGQLALAE